MQNKIKKPDDKSLKDLIVSEIVMSGPMDVGRYMNLCLCHPQHGYYMKQDPFGADGDFTTAPEISQMFGEMIGAWLTDLWMQMGKPTKFYLVEYGPGRGTLMADILRVLSGIPKIMDALNVVLVDASPVLRAKQKEILAKYDVSWGNGLHDVSGDCPIFVIGNEFLDALPVRQFIKDKSGWKERVIGYDAEEGMLEFGMVEPNLDPASIIPEGLQKMPAGTVYEFSPARQNFMDDIYEALKRCGGAALFIDYGEAGQEAGNSLQAIEDHKVDNILSSPGDADVSANVDFSVLIEAAKKAGLRSAATSQGEFLQVLGIEHRAAALFGQASPDQREAIENALRRLCDPDQMGKLFKVMGVWSSEHIKLAGF